jgi:hypothetical protein
MIMEDNRFREIQTKALWEHEEERMALRAKIAEQLQLGRGEQVGRIISLPSGGHVVEVVGRFGTSMWTTVYGGQSDHSYYHTDQLAMIALLARQQEDDPNLTRHAVRYVARALDIPHKED